MPDNLTPDEQEQSSRQQAGGQNEDWKARFDGAIQKIQQLTLENRKLNDDLVLKTSTVEQLQSQLTVKDAEKTAAVGERDKRLQEVITAKTQLDGQLAELRALQLKVKVAKEMGRPDLLPILDTIPSMSDETALKSVLETFANFADTKVKAREKELLAGITPHLGGGGGGSGPVVPTTPEAWAKYIESKPLGSPERAKAMDEQWEFMSKQGA